MMKYHKELKGVLVAVLALSVLVAFIIPASAVPAADDLGVENASGYKDTLVSVPVNITNPQNGPIEAISFDILYNKSVINVTDVQRGNLTSDWATLLPNNTFDWGTSVYVGAGGTVIPDGTNGSVVVFNFSVLGEPGETSYMNLSDIQLVNTSGGMGFDTAPPKNGTFTVGGAQAWYLHNDSEMYKGDQPKPQGNVTINGGCSQIWIANSPAQVDVSFPLNSDIWTGQITFISALENGDTFTVEIGNSSGGTDFTLGGPQATLTGNGSKKAFTFEASAGAFNVPTGKYLALNLTNNNASCDYKVQTGIKWSYISSPETDPGYPVPELSITILFSVGLLALAAYILRPRFLKR